MTSTQAARVGGVRLEIVDGIAIVTIDRPEARNAIGFATVDELHEAVDNILVSEVAVVVITGGGERAFVSGGDLKELSAIRTHEEALAMAQKVRRLLDRIASLPMPVIAALNGHALGGGAEFCVAADIRIAADDVKVGFNQVTLGIMPAWGGIERLTSLIGRSRAMLAVATGEMYDAASAHRLGLLDIVVPRPDFDTTWRAVATQMASLAPGSTQAVKAVVSLAEPAIHPHTEAEATDAFAHLWVADAHWAAVEAMQRGRAKG